MVALLTDPNTYIPVSLIAACLAFLTYAKTHPGFANRWSRMHPVCDGCGEALEAHEVIRCTRCDAGDVAEIPGYAKAAEPRKAMKAIL